MLPTMGRRTLLLLALATACATASTTPATGAASVPSAASGAPGATLYTRLGERPALEAVVHTFVRNVGRDPRVNVRFLLTDLDGLERHLVDQLCAAAGGPCTYGGRPMKSLHAPMRVRAEEFDAMGEDLVAALKTHRVPERESREVLAIVESTRADIVDEGAR